MTSFQSEMQERKALWSRLRAIGKMKGDYHYYPLQKLREITEECERDFEDESNLLHVIPIDHFRHKDALKYSYTLPGDGDDMRAEISNIWDDLPVDAIVFRGAGIRRELWHVAPVRSSMIRAGDYLLVEYYAAPYSYTWGDCADRSKWGFYSASGEWLYIN